MWTRPFATLFVLNILLYCGVDMPLSAMPLYLKLNGAGAGEIGALFGFVYASSILARVSAGPLSRKVGELCPLYLSFVAAAAGCFVFISHDGFLVYLASRILFGLGFGAGSTFLIVLASRSMPPARLAEGLGALAFGATVALSFSPYVGQRITDYYGFSTMLFFVGLLQALGLAAALTFSRSDFPETASAPARASGEAGEGGPPSAETGRPRRGKGARGAAWTTVAIVSILTLLLGGASAGIFSFLVLFLDERGVPGAPRFFLAVTCGIAVTRILGGRLSDRFGHLCVIVPSSLLMTMSFVWLFFIPEAFRSIPAAVMFGLGLGSLHPALQALALSEIPGSLRFAAAASLLNGYDVGIALSTFALAAAVSQTGSYRCVYWAAAAMTALLLALYLTSPTLRAVRTGGRERLQGGA
ncbi:MAG: MFS transporter [Deltaproteobacteria bacterium]|nr:MFS transporter [Deltaproteobacteria bacterium]